MISNFVFMSLGNFKGKVGDFSKFCGLSQYLDFTFTWRFEVVMRSDKDVKFFVLLKCVVNDYAEMLTVKNNVQDN